MRKLSGFTYRMAQNVRTRRFVYYRPCIAYQRHKVVKSFVTMLNVFTVICNQEFQTITVKVEPFLFVIIYPYLLTRRPDNAH